MTPPYRLIALLAALMVLGSACGKTSAEREKRISAEQSAIQGYSAKVPEAIRYQSAFADEWRQVNEIKDLKAYGDAMRYGLWPVFRHLLGSPSPIVRRM